MILSPIGEHGVSAEAENQVELPPRALSD